MSSAERRAMIASFGIEEENPSNKKQEQNIPDENEFEKDFKQEIEENKTS